MAVTRSAAGDTGAMPPSCQKAVLSGAVYFNREITANEFNENGFPDDRKPVIRDDVITTVFVDSGGVGGVNYSWQPCS